MFPLPWQKSPDLFFSVRSCLFRFVLHQCSGRRRNDFLGNRLGHFLVMVKLHAVDGPTLRQRTHVGGVAEHFGKRNQCANDLCVLALSHALNASPAAVEVADHVTHVLLGGDHLDGHNGLHDDRFCPARSVTKSHPPGNLKGKLVGVHCVELSVVKPGTDSLDWVAAERSLSHGRLEAFLNTWNEFLRNGAADDVVDKLETNAALIGAYLNPHLGKLSSAAGLFFVGVPFVDGLADGFAVGHLWLAHVGFNLELTAQAIHDYFQVQLTHTGDDRLAGFLIREDLEGGVLFCQFLEPDAELIAVRFGFRLDSDTNDRLRKIDLLEDDRMVGIAKGIPGFDVLEPDSGGDVTGPDDVDVLPVIRVHEQDAPDPFLPLGSGVQHLRSFVQGAAVYTEEGQLTD